MAKDKITWKDNRGFILGNILGSILYPGIGTAAGAMLGAYSDTMRNDPDYVKQSGFKFWNDVTGKTNTEMQNSAAAELQEDQQEFNASEAQKERDWQEYMSNTAVQRQAADLQAAGFNPVLAAGAGASSGVGAAASSGTASAQASNVSALQSIANTAITAGMLIKILKTLK